LGPSEYVIRTAKATEDAIWQGLNFYLYLAIRPTEPEEFASDLAVTCSAAILGREPITDERASFRESNSVRIEREIRRLNSDHELCEVLSGAAYNIGYGRYVATGGGILVNRYRRFIQADRETRNNSYTPAIRECTELIKKMSFAAIEPIQILKKWGLWVPRGPNPDEREYYQRVQSFVSQQNLLLKRSETSQGQPNT
jgi:hypothetical protein